MNQILNVLLCWLYTLHSTHQLNGEISCNGKITGFFNTTDTQYFQLKLNHSTPVTFDVCTSSMDDIYIIVYDMNGTALVERELSNWICDSFNSKMEVYLMSGEYTIGINPDTFWGFDPSVPWEINIDCQNQLEYLPYKIIHSHVSTVSEAQSECQQLWNTHLATVATKQDLNDLKYMLNEIYSNISDVKLWIGGYNNIINNGKWEWIAPYKLSAQNYFHGLEGWRPYVCKDNCVDEHDVDNLNVIQQERLEYVDSAQAVVCNAPASDGGRYGPQFCDWSLGNCWFSLTRNIEFDKNEFEVPSVAMWNNTLFMIGKNEIKSIKFLKDDNAEFADFLVLDIWNLSKWHNFMYNSDYNTITKPSHGFQYNSSYYLYNYSYNNNEEIIFSLININLENMNVEIIPYTTSFEAPSNIEFCLAAAKNKVYILRQSIMMVYNLETGNWTETYIPILKYRISACSINLKETFIYVFMDTYDIIYKYNIDQNSLLIVRETNLCSNGVGQAITAPNGKAYLHGCYVYGQSKTLVFNMDNEKFEAISENSETWLDYVNSKSYSSDLMIEQHPGHIAILNYNTLIMATRVSSAWSNGIRLTFSWTDILLYNFQKTEMDTKDGIWPSDLLTGITITYEITSSDSTHPPYYVGIYTNDIHYEINDTWTLVDLNQSNDTCYGQTVPFFAATIHTCNKEFRLNLTLKDNNVTELTLHLLPIDTELDYWSMLTIATRPINTKPLIAPISDLTIKLVRCNILLNIINDVTHSGNPYINISYSLETQCHSRQMQNFSFNLNVISSISAINIETEVFFAIGNNYSHTCTLCDLSTNCTFCDNGKISIKHDIIGEDDTLFVTYTSNMIDLNVYSQEDLSVLYLKRIVTTTKQAFKFKLLHIILLASGALSLLLIVTIVILYFFRRNKRLLLELEQQKTLTNYIKNPLVLCIGISIYENNVQNPGTNIYCDDLYGIDRDYENIKALCKLLNYDMYPQKEKYKWSQVEIITFINEMTELVASNIDTLDEDAKNQQKTVDGYDGILCFFSGHGYKNCIVTSDYQLINKTAIHRLMSTNHAELRNIPRVYIFDACDGNQLKSWRNASYNNESESDDDPIVTEEEKGKNFEVNDIQIEQADNILWCADQKNPDYKLALVNGANEGFQAIMSSIHGSYLIYEFVKTMMETIEISKNIFLGDLIDTIQEDLHDRGKQQITSSFNNNTRYLKFINRNDNHNNGNQDNKQNNYDNNANDIQTEEIVEFIESK